MIVRLGWALLATAGALALAPGALVRADAATPARADHRAADPRVLYALNCLGCHPAPLGGTENSRYSRFVEGEFAQTPAGRQFFMRMPPTSQAMTPAQRARLMHEVDNWKRACPVLLRGSTWNLSNLQ